MEIEYWWLLALPLFFALGWLAARIDIHQVVQESRALPRSYLSGLNFLLAEQPDKAIDAFVEAVRIDPQTVELHFALGSLFRRRGETERAIRMHQKLLARRDLDARQRQSAQLELAIDFMKAGLFDRAEALLHALVFQVLPRTAELYTRIGTGLRPLLRICGIGGTAEEEKC